MVKKSCLTISFFIFSLFILGTLLVGKGYAAGLEVGDNKTYSTITAALADAENGDVITVFPGIYKEKVTITKAVTLQSVEKQKAVIQGDHNQHVIIIKSPNVVIQGFTIKGSGHNFLANDAGILVDKSNHVQIINNRMEDILFGIYIDSSNNLSIKNNQIDGLKSKKLSERGNGIHYFNTKAILVSGNTIKNVRDGMYFDHADETLATNNKVTNVRYGLHYMWSDNNSFKHNFFSNNVSGAAIMFSKEIKLENNIFENNRGYRNFGIFFQTAEDSIVANNLFFKNSIGIYSDLSRGNVIRNNTIVQNDIGMEILGSNWDDVIYENSFLDNLQQVSVNEIKNRDQWHKGKKGNYWSEYTGVDIEKDGIGDAAYHSGNAFEFFMYKYPHFRLFVESPTAKLLETVDKMFPVIERAEIVDPFPLTADSHSKVYLDQLRTNSSRLAGIITFSVSLLIVALSMVFIFRLSHRFGG
ncbi:nitrous oxide reductase family maturation protein NosD [Schinkia sp. CFF1]